MPLELFSFEDIGRLTVMACENAAAERVVLHSIAKLLSPAFSAEGGAPAVRQSAAEVERELEKKFEGVKFRKAGL